MGLICEDIGIGRTLCTSKVKSSSIWKICNSKGASSKTKKTLVRRIGARALKVAKVDPRESTRPKVEDIGSIEIEALLLKRPLK